MSKKQKKELIKILVSGALFIASLFTKNINIALSLSLILSLVAFLICGADVLKKAFKNIIRLNALDEHLLMSAAAIGAFLIGEHIEGAAVMIFYQVGELFQSVAVAKSRKSIATLWDIVPKCANVFKNGEYIKVSPEGIAKGDRLLIKPGDRVPVDCEVLQGTSHIDTKAITGESVPKDVGAGDKILSGCININGVLFATAIAEYKNSTVAKIIELTENVSSRKSTYESFIHRFALVYTPVVVALACLLAIIPSVIFGDVIVWIKRALTFLVISCPCALVISVPLSFFAGLGRASSCGILIKGTSYVEMLAHADTVIFDKTGTLTYGELFISDIKAKNVSEEELLKIAASVEGFSNHPIAEAIKKSYKGEVFPIENVKELPGLGICAKNGDGMIYAGNYRLMQEKGIAADENKEDKTTVYFAKEKIYLGAVTFGDKLKENAQSVIASLKQSGIKKVCILTGDKEAVAREVTQKLGADSVEYELLPEDKVKKAQEIMQKQKRVIFVGDGINDAPVMALADVSVSMGQLGQDAAIEASDVVLTDDNLAKIEKAIKISKKTVGIARANIVFSIGIKALVLTLAAFGFTGIWAAVFADVGVCIIAVLNSMRMLLNK